MCCRHHFRARRRPSHSFSWPRTFADDEGWALVGLFGEAPAATPAPFRKELIQVATDGSGRVRRLLHHRSVYRRYEDSPRANISRDGRFVFYTSNMGGTRTDLYVAKITPPDTAPTLTPSPSPTPAPSPTPTTPAAPSSLTATAASSSQINVAWTDNSNNEDGFKRKEESNRRIRVWLGQE